MNILQLLLIVAYVIATLILVLNIHIAYLEEEIRKHKEKQK